MNQAEIKECVEKGGFLCRAICEVLGKPKEHVEKTMGWVVEEAKKMKDATLISHEIAPAKAQGENQAVFSIFAEIEMLFKNKEVLLGFCFDFMPSSIEIIEPEEVNMPNSIFSAWLNELQARLHQIDMVAKEKNAANKLLLKQRAHLVRYNFLSHLNTQPYTKEEMQKKIGIDDTSFKEVVDTLLKRGEIEVDGDKLKLSSKVKFK